MYAPTPVRASTKPITTYGAWMPNNPAVKSAEDWPKEKGHGLHTRGEPECTSLFPIRHRCGDEGVESRHHRALEEAHAAHQQEKCIQGPGARHGNVEEPGEEGRARDAAPIAKAVAQWPDREGCDCTREANEPEDHTGNASASRANE